MEKNGFRTCLPAILFMCAMAFACATAPSAQTMVYPGFELEIGEQAKIHNETGLEYADKGFYAEAIEEYKKAIRISPSYTDAYANCSRAYYAVGDSDLSLYYILKRDDIITQKERAIREAMREDQPVPAVVETAR